MQRSERSYALILLTVASLLVTTGMASGQQLGAVRPSDGAVALSDGVLVDRGGGVAYVMNAEHRVDAIDLGSGSRLWTTAERAKPLLVHRGVLLAQTESTESGRLSLATFGLLDGGPVLDAGMSLPGDVRATLVDSPGRSFRVRAEARDNSVAVAWSESRSTASGTLQGYLPSLDENAAPGLDRRSRADSNRQPLVREGALQLDLDSGTISTLPSSAAPVSGSAVATRRSLGGRQGLYHASADGRHVLASQRDPDGGIWEGFRWTILDSASGSALGELSQHVATAPFVVADSSVIYVTQALYRVEGDEVVAQPMQLQAADLASGTTLWTKAVADSKYIGPIAP